MSLIFRIIRAANARGTHHWLALDGVNLLQGPDSESWQRLFLKDAAALVAGAKAPDDEFKDFQNHVLHPRDGYWGGAADKCVEWYSILVEALKSQDWGAAAWAAGVLSHYLTDPICPLHTGQSEAESSVHRAFEWSVSRSYDALLQAAATVPRSIINVPDDPNWLGLLVGQAALDANQHYEKMIAHYDIHRGVVDPPSGLDAIAQRIIGDLLGKAAALVAVVLERAIAEAKVTPPDVSLTLEAVLGTLRIPLNKVLAKIEDKRERHVVEAIYDELKATGTVVANLSADDRFVRDRYAAEVLAKHTPAQLPVPARAATRRTAESEGERRARLQRIGHRGLPQPGIVRAGPAPASSAPDGREVPVAEPPRPAPMAKDLATPLGPVARFKGETTAPAPVTGTEAGAASDVKHAGPVPVRPAMAELPAMAQAEAVAPAVPEAAATPKQVPLEARILAASASASAAAAAASQVAAAPTQVLSLTGRLASTAAARPRVFLSPSHPIVDAPTIGPKMAEQLAPIGLETVSDLLAADPQKVAVALARSGTTADDVRDWQDQARFVCEVPGLRGTHAQLLVGAGLRSTRDLAAAGADQLCATVLAFAATPAGQRVLRAGDPPDIERIKSWVDNARRALAA